MIIMVIIIVVVIIIIVVRGCSGISHICGDVGLFTVTLLIAIIIVVIIIITTIFLLSKVIGVIKITKGGVNCAITIFNNLIIH